MKRTAALMAATALAGTIATAAPAQAASAVENFQIATRMVEQSPGVGEYDGALTLRVTPDGIVSGYYRPLDDAQFIPVSGGISGNDFWIEIGTFSTHPWRFSGTFNDGKIDASSNTPIVDNGALTGLDLIGTPRRS